MMLWVLVLFLWEAPATHLVYSDSSVYIAAQSALVLLPTQQTISLNSPFTLAANRQYGITFKFNGNVNRTWMAASGFNNSQSRLKMQTNSSMVIPDTVLDFYIVPNVGTQPVAALASLFGVTVSTNNGDAGFGQTFNSGSGGILNSIGVMNAGLAQAALTVELHIYDLSMVAFNTSFPYNQETSQPTTALPTSQPSRMPTFQPTTPFPTRIPTAAPTSTPTTQSPTSNSPTTQSPSPIPTSFPTSPTTGFPSSVPSMPTLSPTLRPTLPTSTPTLLPTNKPTIFPTISPTTNPTDPTSMPTTQTPSEVPTSNPTLFPTVSPTLFPTGSPTAVPTISPSVEPTPLTLAPSTLVPTPLPTFVPTVSPGATPAFFQPPGCDSTSLPIEFRGQTVLCNKNTTDIVSKKEVVSYIVTITVLNENGTEIPVSNLPPNKRITFFIPLVPNITLAAQNSNPCEPQPELRCAWLSNDEQWLESGCQLTSELGQTDMNQTNGRFCTCSHLTSFSLVLRYRTDPEAFCRSTSQYVCAVIAGIIGLFAVIQMSRVVSALRKIEKVAIIHFSIFLACLMLMIISLLTPDMVSVPAVVVLLSSLVTFIELGCYICLLYVWVGAAGSRLDFAQKLKWPFIVFIALTALITIGIPIGIAASTGSHDVQSSLARIGSYLMSSLTALICAGLSLSGFKLRANLLHMKAHVVGKKTCPITTRILVGSIGLSSSVMTQAFLWAASVNDSVLSDSTVADGVELGFNIAAFVTFITLLFMFFFGVNDAVTVASKSRKTVASTAASATLHSAALTSSCSPQLDGGNRGLNTTQHLDAVHEDVVNLGVVQEDDVETA